jgi:hypothetical protein
MIPVATPVVIVLYWNKGNPEKRSFNVKKYYIPEHWIQQGLDYLMMHPYSSGEKRGPKVELSAEARRKRQLLLRKYAVYQSRKRRLTGDLPERTLMEIRLDGQIASVIMEISKVGGVPKRWIETMIRG